MRAKIDPNHSQHAFTKDETVAEVYEMAGMYGYTIDKPRHFRHVIGVQLAHDDPDYFDGVSFWQCPGCKVAWDRFSAERTERFVPKEE